MDPLSFWLMASIASSIASTANAENVVSPSQAEADKIKKMTPRGKETETYRLIEEAAARLQSHPESAPEVLAFLLGVAFALDPLGRMVKPELASTQYQRAARRDEFIGEGPYDLSRNIEYPNSIEIRVNGDLVSRGYQSDKWEDDQHIYTLHEGFVLKKRDDLDSENNYVDRVFSAPGYVKDSDMVSISHDCTYYDADLDERRLEAILEKGLRGEDFDIQVSSRLVSFASRELKDIPGNNYRLLDFVSGMKALKPEEMSAANKEGLEWNKFKKFMTCKVYANSKERWTALDVLRDWKEERKALLPPDPYEEEHFDHSGLLPTREVSYIRGANQRRR